MSPHARSGQKRVSASRLAFPFLKTPKFEPVVGRVKGPALTLARVLGDAPFAARLSVSA